MATGFSVMDAFNQRSKAGIEEKPKARFRTKDISVFKMYRNEMNFYSIEAVEELAGDILTFGLKQNLELVYEPCEKGEYRIVAGERRWLALKMLVSKGYKEFEIATSKLTTPQDANEEQVEIIIANAYRNKSVADMIEEEKRLKESLEKMKAAGKQIKGYDLTSGRLRDVIASMLHMSKTKVAQIESVNNNLIPEFKEELKSERLTFSAAYELSGMSEQEQQDALERFKESGELSHKDIKTMKGEKAGQQDTQNASGEGAETATEGQNEAEPEKSTPETENAENGADTEPQEGNEEHPAAGDDYQTPHPERITSLCYSCKKYLECNVKTGTCTKCDQYINKAESEKTVEQRYSEEQSRIDRETARKLREQADVEKMNNIPSAFGGDGQQIHKIRIGTSFFADAYSNIKSFELRKNDRGYKAGDILEMMEFEDGRYTGRMVRKLVTYMLEDYTGLEDGYCIMATALVNKDGEALQYVDLGQICAEIKANGDGYLDGGDEVILIDKAVDIVIGGGME